MPCSICRPLQLAWFLSYEQEHGHDQAESSGNAGKEPRRIIPDCRNASQTDGCKERYPRLDLNSFDPGALPASTTHDPRKFDIVHQRLVRSQRSMPPSIRRNCRAHKGFCWERTVTLRGECVSGSGLFPSRMQVRDSSVWTHQESEMPLWKSVRLPCAVINCHEAPDYLVAV